MLDARHVRVRTKTGICQGMSYDENRQFSVCGYGVPYASHFGEGAVQCPCGLGGAAIAESKGTEIVQLLEPRYTADEARRLFLRPIVRHESRRMPDERDGLWAAIRRFVDTVLDEGVATRYLAELRHREASGKALLRAETVAPTLTRRRQPRGEWKLRGG